MMLELSEEHFSASWHEDLEFDLWDLCTRCTNYYYCEGDVKVKHVNASVPWYGVLNSVSGFKQDFEHFLWTAGEIPESQVAVKNSVAFKMFDSVEDELMTIRLRRSKLVAAEIKTNLLSWSEEGHSEIALQYHLPAGTNPLGELAMHIRRRWPWASNVRWLESGVIGADV